MEGFKLNLEKNQCEKNCQANQYMELGKCVDKCSKDFKLDMINK
jgi:hypothetical protein